MHLESPRILFPVPGTLKLANPRFTVIPPKIPRRLTTQSTFGMDPKEELVPETTLPRRLLLTPQWKLQRPPVVDRPLARVRTQPIMALATPWLTLLHPVLVRPTRPLLFDPTLVINPLTLECKLPTPVRNLPRVLPLGALSIAEAELSMIVNPLPLSMNAVTNGVPLLGVICIGLIILLEKWRAWRVGVPRAFPKVKDLPRIKVSLNGVVLPILHLQRHIHPLPKLSPEMALATLQFGPLS